MPSTHRNRLVTAISNTPGAAGALTIAAAASGYRTFAVGDDGLSFDVSIVDSTAWEIRTGCAYTHSGTSLARGTLEDSSTGSAITLTSAAVVTATMSAGFGNALERMFVGGFSALGDGTTTTITNNGTSLVSHMAKTVLYDTDSAFTASTGIYFPSKSGLYLVGGTAITSDTTDGSTVAVYIEHSTDGTTWSGADPSAALLWRGITGGIGKVGGSGSFLIAANGSTDRWRMTVFYTGTGTVTVPGNTVTFPWIRFWSKYVGAIT